MAQLILPSNEFVNWNPKEPIRIVPENIRIYFRKEADYLYSELSRTMIYKILIPAPEPRFIGHMIRTYVNQNPSWYRKLYHLYSYSSPMQGRSFKSTLRRDISLRALDRIRNEKDIEYKEGPFGPKPCLGWIDKIYRELIFDRLMGGHKDIGIYTPPVEEVRIFFGLEPTIEQEIRNEGCSDIDLEEIVWEPDETSKDDIPF